MYENGNLYRKGNEAFQEAARCYSNNAFKEAMQKFEQVVEIFDSINHHIGKFEAITAVFNCARIINNKEKCKDLIELIEETHNYIKETISEEHEIHEDVKFLFHNHLRERALYFRDNYQYQKSFEILNRLEQKIDNKEITKITPKLIIWELGAELSLRGKGMKSFDNTIKYTN